MKRTFRVVRAAVTLGGAALLAGAAAGTVAAAEKQAAPAQKAAAPAAGAKAVSAGRIAFNNNCRTCHSVNEGDNRLGPSLHAIIGAEAGTRQGYASYSQSMKSSGIVWDEKTLDRFIANPEDVVRNNNMKPFKGVLDENVRKNIIAFLGSSAATG